MIILEIIGLVCFMSFVMFMLCACVVAAGGSLTGPSAPSNCLPEDDQTYPD